MPSARQLTGQLAGVRRSRQRPRLAQRSSMRRNSLSRAARLVSSSSRFGTITMSNPGASLFRRNISRTSRFALFLTTAPPSFRVAAIPSRPVGKPFAKRNRVKQRP